MRGAILGVLAFAYHFLTKCLRSPDDFLTTCPMAELTAKCEGSRVGVVVGCMPCPAYHVLTISLPSATCAELTANCEGNRFGVAGVRIPCLGPGTEARGRFINRRV